MKMHIRNRFLLPMLVTALGLVSAGRLTAQTFRRLSNTGGSFSILSGNTLYGNLATGSGQQSKVFALNADGSGGLRTLYNLPYFIFIPPGAVVSNTLYGQTSTSVGGDSGDVLALNADGTGIRRLHSFTALQRNCSYPSCTNADGAWPYVSVVSGNRVYGTTDQGGSGGAGTIFAVNTDGTEFKVLHSFAAVDCSGGWPCFNSDGFEVGGLLLSGNTLYGSTSGGGPGGAGAIFAVNTDGTGFTNLYMFTASDGPPGAMILSGNILYGIESGSGSGGKGTVFSVNTDGTGFAVLHAFTDVLASSFTDNYGNTAFTNSDGIYPWDLILSGNTLYGTASGGGSGGNGTVFSVNTDGTGFAVLYSFAAVWPCAFTNSLVGEVYTNSDGAFPEDLILSGNTLYGAAPKGGTGGDGTVFAVNTDGTGFTNLYNFTPLLDGLINMYGNPVTINSDGAFPQGGLSLAGNTLYGGTGYGGPSGNGTLFSISLGPVSPPQLSIIPAGSNVILSWPTNATGYTLHSTTDLTSPSWTTNLPAPVVLNGVNTVTNPTTVTQQFYRLSE